jgi:ribosomal RNA-processing protein 1
MKSRPKNKGKKFVPHQKKRKLSVVSPEVLFAQKLAANDPVQRNRAVKKLQKWLQLRGSLLTKEEIMRIWKGLHYCFWMSDKPLIQEELAETIGHLIHCFPGENALVFIECGLITEGREWVGIDQWRMDKFMMLTRRFLRQAFNFLSKDNWEKVNNMIEIFSFSVILNFTAILGF